MKRFKSNMPNLNNIYPNFFYELDVFISKLSEQSSDIVNRFVMDTVSREDLKPHAMTLVAREEFSSDMIRVCSHFTDNLNLTKDNREEI